MSDKWLKSLNEVPVKALPNYKAAGPNVDGQFVDLIRIDSSDDSEIPYAADVIIQKSKSDLLKSGVDSASWI